ncbi:MAG: tRNA-dihydrouridine synthase [Saccharofermentans sp.]|nr:tRNA-dihydrouridine synthase [Saccharofermentans sp.]
MNEVNIGNINLTDPVCLAPMAGFSSLPFRIMCKRFGSSYAPTELASARSVRFSGIDKSFRYMRIDPAREGISAIQLFGCEGEDFKAAILAIFEDPRLTGVSVIDINMGCPVPKVVKTHSGSFLMTDPCLAASIVSACKEAVRQAGRDTPVTVKTRIGFEASDKGCPELAKAVSEAGCDMLCVHGRTRPQMYSGEADLEAIALMREAVRPSGIPFFANGDITDGASAKHMLEVTGADGLMVGRAARGNPMVFEKILRELKGETYTPPTDKMRKELLMEELEGRLEYLPENIAVREMRSVMPFYVKGMDGAATLKTKLCRCNTVHEVREVLALE